MKDLKARKATIELVNELVDLYIKTKDPQYLEAAFDVYQQIKKSLK